MPRSARLFLRYLLPLLVFWVSLPLFAQESKGGKVTMPLGQWEAMIDAADQEVAAPQAPVNVLHIERAVEGRFHKGVFSGELSVRFIVPEGKSHLRVPIISGETSIGDARLNQRQTSLLLEGPMYTVGVGTSGVHELRTRFFQGREDDRFARRLNLELPPAGPTRFSVWLPERDIEVRVTQGAISTLQPEGEGSRVLGWLDGKGRLELNWKRRTGTEEANPTAVRAEYRSTTVYTLHEALVQGVTDFEARIREGETDRVDLSLPAGIEVVDVTGDAVLQWYTSSQSGADAEGGKLGVLFRYVVSDAARFRVQFQFPMEIDQPVALRLPMPRGEAPFTGALGVQGQAGLEVSVRRAENLTELTSRDLPPDLTDLSRNPLILGYAFIEAPLLELGVRRYQEVDLTDAIVDDIQASTLLIEDGSEIVKLRLRMRNNTRQYLTLRLPPGSTLTHALLDGRPVRPALGEAEDGDASRGELLLMPLQQSERLAPGQVRQHRVREGETLGGIASLYYSNPGQWRDIVEENRSRIAGPMDIVPGQLLEIPSRKGLEVQESSFIVELAYKRRGDACGHIGHRDLLLPEIDVDVVSVTWHLYLPEALEPLVFTANLTQYAGIHYDPFRRVRHFLGAALRVRSAWAGGKYENILSQRRSIYRAEAGRRTGGQEILSSFPFTGRKYRFERILLGRETPRISVSYLHRDILPFLRWTAFAAALTLGLSLLARGSWRARLPALAGLIVLLLLGHHVLGVHRRILWGLDLAVAWDLFARFLRPRLASLGEPPSLRGLLTGLGWRHLGWALAIALMVHISCSLPLLLSTSVLGMLLVARRVLR
jgi:hypothetical protein